MISHTERLLEEKEEKLCIKVLQTLKEMMSLDPDYAEKVISLPFFSTKFLFDPCDMNKMLKSYIIFKDYTLEM